MQRGTPAGAARRHPTAHACHARAEGRRRTAHSRPSRMEAGRCEGFLLHSPSSCTPSCVPPPPNNRPQPSGGRPYASCTPAWVANRPACSVWATPAGPPWLGHNNSRMAQPANQRHADGGTAQARHSQRTAGPCTPGTRAARAAPPAMRPQAPQQPCTALTSSGSSIRACTARRG